MLLPRWFTQLNGIKSGDIVHLQALDTSYAIESMSIEVVQPVRMVDLFANEGVLTETARKQLLRRLHGRLL